MTMHASIRKALATLKLITVHDRDVLASEKGTQELFKEATTNGRAPGSTCKIQFLGDARAGKTSLCKKLRGEPFNPDEKPTFGINTKMCQVNEVDDINWKERTDSNESSEFIDVTTWYLANHLSKDEAKKDVKKPDQFTDVILPVGIIFALSCFVYLFLVIPLHTFSLSWSFIVLVNGAAAVGLITGNIELYRVLAGCSLLPLFIQLLGEYGMYEDVFSSVTDTHFTDMIHSSVMFYFPQWLIVGFVFGFICSCGIRTVMIYSILCAWVPNEPLQISMFHEHYKTSSPYALAIFCTPGIFLGICIHGVCPKVVCSFATKLSGLDFPLRQKDHVAFIILQGISLYTVYESNCRMIILTGLGVSYGISVVYGITIGRIVFVQIENCHICQVVGIVVGCVLAYYSNFDFVLTDISVSSIVGIASRVWLIFQVQALKRRTVGKNQAPVKIVSDKLFQVAANGLKAMKLQKKLSLWDFAGQELYYNTHHAFMSSHAVYLLVFDLSTFNDPVNHFTSYQRIQFWLQSIYCHTSAPIILVGTHLDQVNSETIKETKELFSQKLSTFSLMHNCTLISNGESSFFEIDNSQRSASDDTMILRSALRDVSQHIEPMQKEYPIKWRRFLEYIHEIRRKVESNILPENALVTTVRDLQQSLEGYNNLQELRDMLIYFSEAGEIIYDSVDCVLRQFVVFDPQFLVNFMQSISAPESINTSTHLSAYCTVLRHQGILHFVLAKQILKCEDEGFTDMVLSLLEANDLVCKIKSCHRTDQRDLYLVPSMLPMGHLGFRDLEWDQNFFIDFGDFNPRVILSRMMSRCASYSELSWRSGDEHFIHKNGGLFSLGSHFCFQLQILHPCPSQYLIEVAIRAVPESNPLDLLRHLWNILETIRYRDFPKLRYSCGILCPHPAPHPRYPDETMFHVIPLASHRQTFTEEDKIVRLCFTRLVEFPLAKNTQCKTKGTGPDMNNNNLHTSPTVSTPILWPHDMASTSQQPCDLYVSCSPRDDGWVKENVLRLITSPPHSLSAHVNKYDTPSHPNLILNAKVLKETPVILLVCSKHYTSDLTGRLRYEREIAYRYKLKIIPIIVKNAVYPKDLFDVDPIHFEADLTGLKDTDFHDQLVDRIHMDMK